MSTQIQLRSWVAGLLVCLFPTCVAAADPEKPELKPDQLVVSAQVLDNNGVTGQVIEVDWVHPFTPGFTFVAGGYYSEIGDARLAFGRVGGGGSVGKWTSIEGALDLGKVREQPVDFDYRVARIYITQLLVPGKLDLLIEDRFLDIGQARGNLLKVGFGIPTWSVGTVGVAYHGTTSGILDSWAATLRYDFRGPEQERPLLKSSGTHFSLHATRRITVDGALGAGRNLLDRQVREARGRQERCSPGSTLPG